MNVAITGVSGFVGRNLSMHLLSRQVTVTGLHRGSAELPVGVHATALDTYTNLQAAQAALGGADALIHLAALAHNRDGSHAPDAAHRFDLANHQSAVAMARAARIAGVRTFVLVSSIGVHGDRTSGLPFTERDAPAPLEPYAVSKLAAEVSVSAELAGSDTACVIVRPPLVYGPHCPGNFARLARVVSRLPLVPLGDLRAARSFIGIDNLCDALWVAATHPGCRHGTFVVADEQTTCVAEVAQIMLRASGRGAWRMLSVPRSAMAALFQVAGRGDEFAKLSGELVVDPTLFRETTGWRARKSCQIGIEEAAASLLGSNPAPR
jgi:UDP-4-keto-D-FucNAc 4-reductase